MPKTTKSQKGSLKGSEEPEKKISNPALQRITHRAGVERASSDIYDELRAIMRDYTSGIVRNAKIYAEHDNRKTVYTRDLEAALKLKNKFLVAGINPSTSQTYKSCNSVGKTCATKKSTTTSEAASSSDKKPRRYRPGTQARRAITRQQKYSEHLAIPKANFERLARSVIEDSTFRFSNGVIDLLQIAVESYLIDICRVAYILSKHANRKTMSKSDITVVFQIRGGVVCVQ